MAKKDKGAAAPEDTQTDPVPTTEAKERKSIVPAGWKSKGDALSKFINEQATGKDGFEFPGFFALMRINEVPEDQVAKYESQVAAKQAGANGRAKMTLRNILVPIIRKRGPVIALDGSKTDMDIPKPAPSGAAAKAKADAASKEQATA
jgi:hypothetical protein